MDRTRREFFALAWRAAVLAGLSSIVDLPGSAEAAVIRRYVDNRLTTGANNGLTPSDAFRSLEDLRAAIAGTNPDEIVFVAGSGPYREAFGTRVTRYKTDLSFQASDRSLNSTVTALNTFGFVAGDVVQVFGSPLNSKQLTINTVAANKITFIASNTVQDEAAGNKVVVTCLQNGSNLSALDPGTNGLANKACRWLFNGVEIDCGRTLNRSNGYIWTPSAAKPGEWFVRRSDLSNPSLLQPKCGTLDDVYISDSADLDLEMGTVGSLTDRQVMGFGDIDSLGFSTVYLKSVNSPEERSVRVGQVYAGIRTNWQFHSFEDGVFSYGNLGNANGVGIANSSSSTWWVKRCVFKFQASHGVENIGTGACQTLIESCLTYFAGHRGYYLNSDSVLSISNCLDYGSHLFLLFQSTLTVAAQATVINCISAYNEAGCIDKKAAAAVLVEHHNVWYPRFGAAGAGLSYVSAANWPTTHATDFPPSAATTISTQIANRAAGAVDPVFHNPNLMPSSIDGLRPTAASLRGTGKTLFFMVGKDGKRFRLSAFDRGPWVMVNR